MRITGNEPTFKWRSEAKWAVAVTSRSSIFTDIENINPCREKYRKLQLAFLNAQAGSLRYGILLETRGNGQEPD